MDARKLAIAAVMAGLLIWWMWPEGQKLGPEQAVHHEIALMIAAADKKDAAAVIERLSDRFQGQDGGGGVGTLDRRQAKAAIILHLQRGSWANVFVVSEDFSIVQPDLVEVTVNTVLARGNRVESLEDIAPQAAGAYAFKLLWELEDDEWRIVRGAYKRLSVRSLLP